jgi:hypothetical protein
MLSDRTAQTEQRPRLLRVEFDAMVRIMWLCLFDRRLAASLLSWRQRKGSIESVDYLNCLTVGRLIQIKSVRDLKLHDAGEPPIRILPELKLQ